MTLLGMYGPSKSGVIQPPGNGSLGSRPANITIPPWPAQKAEPRREHAIFWGVYATVDNSESFGSFAGTPGNHFLNMVWSDPSSVLARICNM